MTKLEKILLILDGIDKEENDYEKGWWPTSTGAEFGERIIKQIKEVFDDDVSKIIDNGKGITVIYKN